MTCVGLLALVATAHAVDLATFLAAGDLGELLSPSLSAPQKLTLPTELHILFIGFHTETANATEAELMPWFQQLRSVLPHSVLPPSAQVVASW